MAYYINNEEVTERYFQEELLEAIKTTCEEDFDDFLDEVNEPIKIMGITYDVSFVLQKVDPIAYDMVMSEYIDNLYQELMYDMGRGKVLILNNITFIIGE